MIDIAELACELTGLDYDEIDADHNTIEQAIYDSFNTDIESLERIVKKLLPMIDSARSGLTGKMYKGFAKVDEDGRGYWLAKIEVKP